MGHGVLPAGVDKKVRIPGVVLARLLQGCGSEKSAQGFLLGTRYTECTIGDNDADKEVGVYHVSSVLFAPASKMDALEHTAAVRPPPNSLGWFHGRRVAMLAPSAYEEAMTARYRAGAPAFLFGLLTEKREADEGVRGTLSFGFTFFEASSEDPMRPVPVEVLNLQQSSYKEYDLCRRLSHGHLRHPDGAALRLSPAASDLAKEAVAYAQENVRRITEKCQDATAKRGQLPPPPAAPDAAFRLKACLRRLGGSSIHEAFQRVMDLLLQQEAAFRCDTVAEYTRIGEEAHARHSSTIQRLRAERQARQDAENRLRAKERQERLDQEAAVLAAQQASAAPPSGSSSSSSGAAPAAQQGQAGPAPGHSAAGPARRGGSSPKGPTPRADPALPNGWGGGGGGAGASGPEPSGSPQGRPGGGGGGGSGMPDFISFSPEGGRKDPVAERGGKGACDADKKADILSMLDVRSVAGVPQSSAPAFFDAPDGGVEKGAHAGEDEPPVFFQTGPPSNPPSRVDDKIFKDLKVKGQDKDWGSKPHPSASKENHQDAAAQEGIDEAGDTRMAGAEE